MPAKRILMYEEARKKIAEGARRFSRSIAATYGPKGGNVVIERSWGAPRVTRDGYTVAREVEFEDAEENLGARILRDAVERTHEEAGDGTTTACVIAEALLEGGLTLAAAGYDPMGVARGVRLAADAISRQLDKISKPVRSTRNVAYVATVACAGDERLGELVAQAQKKAGEDGIIVVEEGKSIETTLETIEGLQFDRGYLSPYFVTDRERMEAVLEDVNILMFEKRLSSIDDFLPLLEKISEAGKPLLVISEDVEGAVLATLVVNNLQGTLRCCAVKAPGYGEKRKRNLEDIAAVTGGRAIIEETGIKLQDVGMWDLGHARKVVIGREETTIVGGAGDEATIKARMEQIREEIAATDSDYDREQLEKRLARLAGGVVEISVGGATEVEVKYRKMLLEGAISAVRAALVDGVVPGGGVALLRAAERTKKIKTDGESEEQGARLMLRVAEAPLRRLLSNAGVDPTAYVEKIRDGKGGYGFNLRTMALGDLSKAGVIDPTFVVKTALRNAVSAASMLLTTDVSVTELPESKAESETMPNLDDLPDY